MNTEIYISGRVTEETYSNFAKQLAEVVRSSDSSDIYIYINSIGGSVRYGEMIYDLLMDVKETGIHVTTVAQKAQSIASIILAAGDTRIVIDELQNPILMHFPYTKVEGDSKKMRMTAIQLEAINKRFIQTYGRVLTIGPKQIEELLTQDKPMTAQKALEIGLATKIQQPLEAVAEYTLKNEIKMTKTKTNKLVSALKEALGLGNEIVAEYKILTADGTELVFPATEDEPVVGDVVASDIKDGEYLMPNEDVWVIKDGKLDEIKAKEEELPAELDVVVEAEVTEEVELTVDETEDEEINEIALMLKGLKEQMDKQAEEIKKLKEEVEKLKEDTSKEIEEEIVALRKQIGTKEIGEIENRPKSWINARINR